MINKNNELQNKIAKESIFTALMILMEKKAFLDISITEITKKAGVSRMAFYRNYNVKEDIISSYLAEFFDAYSKEILSNEEISNYEGICFYFAYFRKHEKFITNLINSKLTYLLLESSSECLHAFSKNFTYDKSYSPETEAFNNEFIAGGFFNVLMKWAITGMKESDENMATILCEYCM